MTPAPTHDQGVLAVVLVTPGVHAVNASDPAEVERFWTDLGRPQHVVERHKTAADSADVSKACPKLPAFAAVMRWACGYGEAALLAHEERRRAFDAYMFPTPEEE